MANEEYSNPFHLAVDDGGEDCENDKFEEVRYIQINRSLTWYEIEIVKNMQTDRKFTWYVNNLLQFVYILYVLWQFDQSRLEYPCTWGVIDK